MYFCKPPEASPGSLYYYTAARAGEPKRKIRQSSREAQGERGGGEYIYIERNVYILRDRIFNIFLQTFLEKKK